MLKDINLKKKVIYTDSDVSATNATSADSEDRCNIDKESGVSEKHGSFLVNVLKKLIPIALWNLL